MKHIHVQRQLVAHNVLWIDATEQFHLCVFLDLERCYWQTFKIFNYFDQFKLSSAVKKYFAFQQMANSNSNGKTFTQMFMHTNYPGAPDFVMLNFVST